MTQSETSPLNPRTVREIVSHRYRRYLVLELESAESVSVDELVRRIARRDPALSSDSLDRSTRREIAIELVHDHLPRLDAHGVLEYDRESDDVALAPEFDDVPPLESVLEELADL